jgi:hypothetical protein
MDAGNILDIAAKIGESVAVISLALLIWEHHKREGRKEILEWQRVVVFRVIAERGPIEEKNIKGHYFDEAQQFGMKKLQDKDIQPTKITGLVLDLLENRAIIAEPGLNGSKDLRYSANVENDYSSKFDFDNILTEMRQHMNNEVVSQLDQQANWTRQVHTEIRANGGKYSDPEIIDHFRQSRTVPVERVGAILIDLERHGLIHHDSNGKLRPRIFVTGSGIPM